ncbi:MAG: hypothetical protein ACLQSX_13495 [Smithella sp.]|jgi:hypothetical protein
MSKHEFKFLKAFKKSNDNPATEERKSPEAIAKRWDMVMAKFSRKKRK